MGKKGKKSKVKGAEKTAAKMEKKISKKSKGEEVRFTFKYRLFLYFQITATTAFPVEVHRFADVVEK